MGPTMPALGLPSASTPKPPSRAIGVQPVSMKNAVMRPQAMKAAMFGMIMPDRNVPNFWTATRVPPLVRRACRHGRTLPDDVGTTTSPRIHSGHIPSVVNATINPP